MNVASASPVLVEELVDRDLDRHRLADNIDLGCQRIVDRVPPRYREATLTVPEIREWTRRLLIEAVERRPHMPTIQRGSSLLLLGATGTGKTYQAYGAVQALSLSGAACRWNFLAASEIYARLRPRHGLDSEDEFHRLATTSFLVIDDLGAAKATDWTEEVNYRLINYRYENTLPTLLTSNVPPRELGATLGDRVASRIIEMTQRLILKGPDRRRTTARDDAT